MPARSGEAGCPDVPAALPFREPPECIAGAGIGTRSRGFDMFPFTPSGTGSAPAHAATQIRCGGEPKSIRTSLEQ